jgi:pimeloyl-ACP methyl ester carboxylesterase
MKNSIFLMAILLLTTITASSQTNKAKNENTIVIIHGAWSSSNDWQHVSEDLIAGGNSVFSVNLPGHGSDNTSISTISLKLYVDTVKKAIGSKQNVVLVGHSFGGIVASQVAEEIAPQIKKIIYIAAYVPKNGESLLTIAQTDAESHVGKNLIVEQVLQVLKKKVSLMFSLPMRQSRLQTM